MGKGGLGAEGGVFSIQFSAGVVARGEAGLPDGKMLACRALRWDGCGRGAQRKSL